MGNGEQMGEVPDERQALPAKVCTLSLADGNDKSSTCTHRSLPPPLVPQRLFRRPGPRCCLSATTTVTTAICGTRLCTYDSLKITWAPSACLPVRSGQSRVTVRGRRASGFPCSTKMASLVFRLAAGTRHAVQQVPTLARAGNRARDRPLFVQTGVASYVERDARRSTLFHAPCRRVLAKSPYPGISVRLRRRDGSQNRCPSRARS